MSDLSFDVAVRRADPLTFTVGGDSHEFSFVPPKSAVMLMPLIEDTNSGGIALTKATFDWLSEGLSEEDNARLVARLRDPKDDFDVPTLTDIIQGLSEKVGGRPTM